MRRRKPLEQFGARDIVADLARRQHELDRLREQRDAVAARLASLNARIATLEPDAASRKGGAGRGTLAALLHTLLTNRAMTLPELTAAAKRAGHSKSKNFTAVVSIALFNRKLFKRVARGVYTSK